MKESKGTGLWTKPHFPHRGWAYVSPEVEDLGDLTTTCEVCKVVRIRHVHHLEHPEWPERVRAGCICASHLLEDYVGPRQREAELKNAARRRQREARKRSEEAARARTLKLLERIRFITHGWGQSKANKNPVRVIGHARFVIYPVAGGYAYTLYDVAGDDPPIKCSTCFPSPTEAKGAIFDLIYGRP